MGKVATIQLYFLWRKPHEFSRQQTSRGRSREDKKRADGLSPPNGERVSAPSGRKSRLDDTQDKRDTGGLFCYVFFPRERK